MLDIALKQVEYLSGGLMNRYYCIRITKSNNKESWPVGSYLYWHTVCGWEMEDNHGPGLMDGFRTTKDIYKAERYDSKEAALQEIDDFLAKNTHKFQQIELELLKVDMTASKEIV